MSETRPAFYALESGGWRDYVTLLHPPYTLWHLSYVAIGAALAPELHVGRLGWTLLAFALALGVAAHALDELQGRPLRTGIPTPGLVALAVATLGAAVAIGAVAALAWTLWLLPAVAFGAFVAVAYNLELLGGRLHTPLWFALAWGAFPVLTGYLAVAERLAPEAFAAAAFAALLSGAQRELSTAARDLRRRTRAVEGFVERDDGSREQLSAAALRAAPERALRLLTLAVVALAVSLLLLRLA